LALPDHIPRRWRYPTIFPRRWRYPTIFRAVGATRPYSVLLALNY
jgi:hypothetical protein